jgi:hypothetical protein
VHRNVGGVWIGGCAAIIAAFTPRNSTDAPKCHMWHNPTLDIISPHVFSMIRKHTEIYDVHIYIKRMIIYDHPYYAPVKLSFDSFIEELNDCGAKVTIEEYSECIAFQSEMYYDYEHTLYCGIHPIKGVWRTDNYGRPIYFSH